MRDSVYPSSILLFAGLALSGCADQFEAASKDEATASSRPLRVSDAHPAYDWAAVLWGEGDEDEIKAITTDTQGNIYVSGTFDETLNIEGFSGEPFTASGETDIMLIKFNPDESVEWARAYGGEGEDAVFAMTSDADDNIYLSGAFTESIVFGDYSLSSSGVDDREMMVVRVDADGDVDWAVSAGGTGADGGNEIEVGPRETVVVIADSNGDFEARNDDEIVFSSPRFGDDPRTSHVLTLDASSGAFQWGASVIGDGAVRGKCLTVSSAGIIYMGGDYDGAMDLVGEGDPVSLPEAETRDAFLSAWNKDGKPLGGTAWGGAGADLCKAAVATPAGDVYLVGYFTGETMFNETSLEANRQDLFVWKINRRGETIWLRQVTSPALLGGAEAVLGPDDGLLFGFQLTDDVTFTESDGAETRVALPTPRTQWPLFVGYTADGDVDFTLLPEDSDRANFSELSRAGDRVYVDIPIRSGTYTVGDETWDESDTKDALLGAIDLTP
ncbi:MAG: hypothetical protein AAFV53_39995 [Myxococcota bacterium]